MLEQVEAPSSTLALFAVANSSRSQECRRILSLDMTLAGAIDVINGLFQAKLDFDTGAFTGDARWLQIDVCCS